MRGNHTWKSEVAVIEGGWHQTQTFRQSGSHLVLKKSIIMGMNDVGKYSAMFRATIGKRR